MTTEPMAEKAWHGAGMCGLAQALTEGDGSGSGAQSWAGLHASEDGLHPEWQRLRTGDKGLGPAGSCQSFSH